MLDNDNNKIYSDESNRVEMLRDKIVPPAIVAEIYEGSDEISIELFGSLYYKDIMAETITGIEVFKVENNNYIKLGDFRDKSEKMYYHLEDGESLTLAFRAYLESRKLYFSEYGFYVINNKING